MLTWQTEWSRKLRIAGEGGYPEYRIPGVVATEQGTILCCMEARRHTHDDWSRIDLQLTRSTDDGQSWSTQTIQPMAVGGGEQDTLNNPVMIANGAEIHLIFHLNYARAFHCLSTDEGASWSDPEDITAAFDELDAVWNVCATGPGHGIVTRDGRLIAPVWIANGQTLDERGVKHAHHPSTAGSIYSEDGGRTWHGGALVTGIADANETTIAERGDGSILFNIRNCDAALRRVLAISPDGISGFEEIRLCDDLPDPMCFGSMARLENGCIAFVNCQVGEPAEGSRSGARENLTLQLTADGGASWQTALLVDKVGGYADLAARGNALYLLYESCPWEKKVVEHLTLVKYSMLS